jgi:hypothetical protein
LAEFHSMLEAANPLNTSGEALTLPDESEHVNIHEVVYRNVSISPGMLRVRWNGQAWTARLGAGRGGQPISQVDIVSIHKAVFNWAATLSYEYTNLEIVP